MSGIILNFAIISAAFHILFIIVTCITLKVPIRNKQERWYIASSFLMYGTSFPWSFTDQETSVDLGQDNFRPLL